jgi:hypothetical protein
VTDILSTLPYDMTKTISAKEAFYHTTLHVLLTLALGRRNFHSELETSNGRIDLRISGKWALELKVLAAEGFRIV